jgi:hypothetical protein
MRAERRPTPKAERALTGKAPENAEKTNALRVRGAMGKNEKASSALEVPQGAAAHPAGTPDGVTARHGTRSS